MRGKCFLSFLVMLVCLFVQVCSADEYALIKTTQDEIFSQIDTGDYISAESATNKMAADFADNKIIARRVWEIANRYDKVEAYQYAKALSERVAADYPKDKYASYANLLLAKLNVYDLIDAGNYESAYMESCEMMKSFPSHKQTARRLWEIANRLDKFKAYEYSKSLCQKLTANYPKDQYTSYAGLQLAKLEIYELIDAGNYESAEKAITQMMKDFAKQRQLPRRLYEIAHQYEKKGQPTYAAELHGRITEGWPNDEYSSRAAFKYKMTINTIVNENKIYETEAAIEKLAIDYEKNPLLAKKLPKTMLNIAEMCYEKGENSKIEKEYADKLQNLSSELLEKYVVGKTTGSTLTTAYYLLGLKYDKFGEYTKAADAFKKAYKTDPKFKYADYCLFAQGYCYEKLLNKGLVSETEGKPIITIQYSKLLSNYPKSKYAQYAGEWLRDNR